MDHKLVNPPPSSGGAGAKEFAENERRRLDGQWEAASDADQGGAAKAYGAYQGAHFHYSPQRHKNFYDLPVREKVAWLAAYKTSVSQGEAARLKAQATE